VKPLDSIQEHGNEHFSFELTDYSGYCAFEGLPVLETDSLDLLSYNTKEEEVTRGQVRALSRLCHPLASHGLETIIGPA
jgi:hypothetical protein